MKQLVKGDGPLNAPVLWVGEAPGNMEVIKGRPFVGPTGQLVRRTLRWAGISPDHDVRFTNAVQHNPGSFPVGLPGARLLKQYADELDAEIASMTNLKVIVACGGPALTRLTGRRSVTGTGWGIGDWRGSVFRNADIPDMYSFAPSINHIARLPEDIIIIATLHPAGIMRSKGRDDMTLFRRDVQKIRHALDGTLSRVDFHLHLNPSTAVLNAAAESARVVYLDTEFDRETHQVYWLGLTFDGINIYGMEWSQRVAEWTKAKLESKSLIKAAHNIHAERRSLEVSGGGVLAAPW